jgi:sugar lactone lactonase YvrE
MMKTATKRQVAMLALLAITGWLAGCQVDHDATPARQAGTTAANDRGGQAAAARQGAGANGRTQRIGNIETVATFDGPMPTGVTVSHDGRVFVNFPRWGDTVEYTVAELKDGKPVAYPNAEINQYDQDRVAERLVSVQSVVVDPANRLWILDTGSLHMGPAVPGGPKLVGVDLKTNQVFKTISFPSDVALPTTYLNDIRFDLRKGGGGGGIAYITDSGAEGPNGIVVVDLQSGHSWRRLTGHPSVKATPQFAPRIEGDPLVTQPLMNRPVPGTATSMTIGSDGITLSADGTRLFYTPLASHHLYSVSTDVLANEQTPDTEVQKTIVDHGDRGYASDGLECDSKGRLYLTDYEHNAIHRRPTDSTGEVTTNREGRAVGVGAGRVVDDIVAQDPRMIWPDTMSIGTDGYLYFTANQLDRQKQFNEGRDVRQKPYSLFRIKIDAMPVLLSNQGQLK